MINSVVFREDVDAEEFIEALTDKDLGPEVLADYLEDRYDEVTTLARHRQTLSPPEEERTPRDEEDHARDDQFEVPRAASSSTRCATATG